MKTEELTALGLTEEQAKNVQALNGRDVEKAKAQTEGLKEQIVSLNQQLSERSKDLEELKAKSGDAESTKQELEKLQEKYKADTEAFQKALSDRDYSDAMKSAIASKQIQFSSKAAEKQFLADLKEKNLPLKEGAMEGFDAFMQAMAEADPHMFTEQPKSLDSPPPMYTTGGTGTPAPALSLGAKFAQKFNAQIAAKTNKE